MVAACGTLGLVAIVDEARGLQGFQSSLIIGSSGCRVAARILANQFSSAQAHDEVRDALARRELALEEADAALDRVREANETLRASEEHLRLVFDAAVDGFVELDDRGVVIRANEAFARMVSLDLQAIEGQPWTALAAAVEAPTRVRVASRRPARPRSSGPTDSRSTSRAASRRFRRRPPACCCSCAT